MATPVRPVEQQRIGVRRAERLTPTTLLAFVAIAVFLGVNIVGVRISNRELPPFWGATLRFALGAVILFGIVGARRLALPRSKALLGAVVFGVVQFGAAFGFGYWGLLHVPSGMAGVVYATGPLITLLLAVALRMERFSRRGAIGAVIVVLGIGLAFQEQVSADVPLVSLLAMVLSATCVSLGGIVVKGFPRNHPITANAIGMTVGATSLLALSVLVGEARHLPTLAETWVALGWMVASTILAFVLMVWVLSRWSASATSYSTVLMPLVAVVTGAWLVGEGVEPVFLVGSALALFGVYIGALTQRS